MSTLDSVQTPLTMKMSNGTYVVIHEANLVDYPRMFLAGPRMESRTLRAALAPWADGVKVRGRTPLVTPWRTIQLADRVEDLQPQVLTLNLNPPSRLADASWIVPQKYVGIWWGMHLNTMTWSSGPKHGATTANTQQVHRLRRGERLQGGAGRGMERRLGRRLDQESERVHVHEVVSRLRSPRSRRLREVEGSRPDRAQ